MATPVSFVNAGAEGSAASGDITLGAPASPATNDVWIAAIFSSDNVTHTFTDWTQLEQKDGVATAHLSIWYFRYAGSTPNLIVGHAAGATIVGGIASFRGCKTSGSPVHVMGTANNGTGTSILADNVTISMTGCALLNINGADDDTNRDAHGTATDAFEDVAGGSQRSYQSAAGTPDASVALIYILDVGTGSQALNQAIASSENWITNTVALEPVPVPSLVRNPNPFLPHLVRRVREFIKPFKPAFLRATNDSVFNIFKKAA